MKKTIVIASLLASLAVPADVFARPTKGFHTGPYLLLEVGAIQSDFDYDMASQLQIGNEFEPSFGFLFGWNLWDEFSVELQGRYATNINSSRHEHIGAGNVFAKYTFVTDALTNFDTFRVLPFVKLGPAVRVSVLPAPTTATRNNDVQVGYGLAPGAGIAFLWKQYFYFGIDVQGDLLFFEEIHQTVNGVPDVYVYKGGFHPGFAGMAMVGVHY